MAEVDTSIYRPQPQQGVAAFNPLQLLELAQQSRNYTRDTAIGQAAAAATEPGGLPDPAKVWGILQRDPRAQGNVLPTVQDLQTLQRGGVALQAESTALKRDWTNAFGSMVGSLANKPDVSPADFYHAAAIASRYGVPPEIIREMTGDLPRDPAGLKSLAVKLGNMTAGYGATVLPTIQGPPQGTTPSVTNPGAAAYRTTGGAAAAPGMAVGLPVAEEVPLADSAKRGSEMQSTASTTAQYHADLDNLKLDSKILDNLGGPTADVEKRINQLTQRLGGFGVTMSAEQLKAQESFDKIANQISLNQSKLFHGSDAGLHTVVGANPSTSMSRYGRDGVIDMLQGNQDAIDVTRKAWMDARSRGAAANRYDQFIHEFSQYMDPRVFQFNRLSRENQQKFLSNMDASDLTTFEQKYRAAIERKWVKPLKAK